MMKVEMPEGAEMLDDGGWPGEARLRDPGTPDSESRVVKASRILMIVLGLAILGFASVALAAILLGVYVDRDFNHGPLPAAAPTPVLVAKQLVPKGTPGSLVIRKEMYVATTLPRKEIEDGAISDPAYLSGRASAMEISPGQQLTASAFTPP